MRRMLFFPDDDADPVWDASTEAMVDLDALDLPAVLRADLRAWARHHEKLAYEEIELSESATRPDVSDLEDRLAMHEREGRALWRRLQDALADDRVVGWASFPEGGRHVEWVDGGAVEPAPPGPFVA